MLKTTPLVLKGVSTIGSVSLGPNPGVPFFINVSSVIQLVPIDCYNGVQNTYIRMLFGFGIAMEAVWPSLKITLRVL